MLTSGCPVRLYKAFTLIELLVVISIVALLIAILLPALGKARMSARSIKCKTQMKQVGFAYFTYGEDYKGELPRCSDGPYNPNDVHAGHAKYLGSTEGNNHVQIEQCPSIPNGGFTYQDDQMFNGKYFKNTTYCNNPYMWYGPTRTFDDPISDGKHIPPSTAAMLGENDIEERFWDYGNQWVNSPDRFQWRHGGSSEGAQDGITNLTFFDGHVADIKGSSTDNSALINTWGDFD